MHRTVLPCFLLCPSLLLAQAGTLDPAFGSGGLTLSELSFYDDEVHALAVQADGKTIGAGWTDDGSNVVAFVQRLRTDGTPDPAFGFGGVTYSSGPGELRYAYAVALQSTGNIIVAGLVYDINMDGNAMLLRYLPDGTADPSFGTDGFISLDYGAAFGFQSAWAMQVMEDDRIMLVGEEGENGIACVRLSADGVPDAGFGTGGLALTGIQFSTGLCMELQDNGFVTVGGYRVDSNGESDWVLARFVHTGALDPGFGTAGVAIVDIGGTDSEFMRGLDILSDERIAVCGYRNHAGPGTQSVVALFAPDGTLDPTFDTDGLLPLAFTEPQWSQARSLVVGADDKILVAGFLTNSTPTTFDDFLLIRLLPDGSFDPSFANGGQVQTDVSGAYDRSFAMALAPSGAIVLAGYGTGSDRTSAYARYHNDIGMGVPAATTGETGLAISPNPAKERVYIGIGDGHTLPRSATLFTMEGTMVFSGRLVADGSGKGAWLELPPGLPEGAYVIAVDAGKEVQRAKLLVMRE